MPDLRKFDISPSLAILVSGVLIAGAIVYVNLNPAPVAVAEADQLPANVDVPIPSANDHIYGSADARIFLIEYSDFQCPYCKMVYPTLKRIVDESNGEVAWAHRSLPLESIHPEAKPAALASECIAEELGNDSFWRFAGAIYADQSKMNETYYKTLAAQLGADPSTFATCVSSQKYSAKIDAEALDAQKNGGTGTPFTIVMGNDLQVPVSGALPYAQSMAVINAVKARQ